MDQEPRGNFLVGGRKVREFTTEAIVRMRVVGQLYNETLDQI